MLYIFKRKKDQPPEERENSQSVRTIKTYSVENLEYLVKKMPEIKVLCEHFKARAYIHVQGQNHSDVSLEMMIALAERIKNGVTNQRGLFESVVGKIKTKEKRWIVDIDTKDAKTIKRICDTISTLKPEGPKVECEVPTKNGVHLITSRFDLMSFSKIHPDVDIQKKNPTLLYLPNSLS